jgi:hypothetical protein
LTIKLLLFAFGVADASLRTQQEKVSGYLLLKVTTLRTPDEWKLYEYEYPGGTWNRKGLREPQEVAYCVTRLGA